MHGSSMNATDNEADGGGVRLQDFWAALDVVRPASLVGNSVGSSWGRSEVSRISSSVMKSTEPRKIRKATALTRDDNTVKQFM